MFLEEQIDNLKKKFSPEDFNIPFTKGSNILRSIEKKFIRVKDVAKNENNLELYFNSWSDNIKNKIEVKSIRVNKHKEWLDHLDKKTNYWMVVTKRNYHDHKHLVFDCKVNSIIELFLIVQSDFFIVDKKYGWFTYFKVNMEEQTATIFRSGEILTPFETL